jgi:cysteinyl-tRNA synthetase
MSLMIYNTMTRTKEPFETLEPGVVRMYVCGVTVYSDSHIGHALMAITFDVIRRYLEWRGYTVQHAQNFTDVDDKIIIRAAELGIGPLELSGQLIDAWHRESAALNVLPATVYPQASAEIPHMIEMIEGLIRLGLAYPVEGGDVNYAVDHFPGYGKLSRRKLDDMLAGARVEVDSRKRHPMDFVLWKAAKPGEPSWDSPWGPGRPGWHIECSVMAKRHLGDRIDIHGGGADLIFPHHENEIAQSEAFEEQRPFARYWVHNALLQFAGDKMSKSIGNLVTTRELIEAGNAQPFRLMVLQAHYRHPLTFSEEGLVAARRGYERLVTAARGLEEVHPNETIRPDTNQLLSEATNQFQTAMDDDFNTPVAVSVLFDLARAANQADGTQRQAIQRRLVDLATVLGLELDAADAVSQPAATEPFIDLLVELRNELRRQRQWELADSLRDRLQALGVSVEDTEDGPVWRWSTPSS